VWSDVSGESFGTNGFKSIDMSHAHASGILINKAALKRLSQKWPVQASSILAHERWIPFTISE
jgi:hypothetical protein